MPVPAVTCGAKIIVAWNSGGGLLTAALSAVATYSPTSWTWTILSVPVGLEALLTGTWGDFVDGVATTGAGSSSAVDLVGIPTDTASGTIVVQAVATNGTGPSVPATDRAAGQQCVIIRSEVLGLEFPGNRQYDWGIGQLEGVLRAIEADASVASFLTATPTTNPISIAAAWANISGLSITFTAQTNESVLLLFEGSAYRAAGMEQTFIRFAVDGVALYTPAQVLVGATGYVINVGTSLGHKFTVGGSVTITVQGAYNSTYGPWSLYDGRLQVLRFR